MKKEELSNIIKQGENQNIEFKSNFNIQVIETLVAFANTKGGKIYIGVSDSGLFENNLTIEKETIPNWLNEIKTKTQPILIPDIELIEIENQQIVEISIQEFPIKPVSCRGKYFKRAKNSNHQMSINEISEIYLKTFNTSWDNYFTNDYNLENISLEKVNNFIDLSNKIRENAITDDPFTVLRKFELVKEEKISNCNNF
ncbi:MAG: putative DNA binding domain-containing protein [Bacteroidales bacterium]|nr:putative DNA binding domain-containing protein [Bacteroidales bacterium]